MNRPQLVLVLAACAALCRAQTPASMWEKAITRWCGSVPKAFPELPSNLRVVLERRGCTIPQVPMIEGRQNVIKDAKAGQTDWAVLCSVEPGLLDPDLLERLGSQAR